MSRPSLPFIPDVAWPPLDPEITEVLQQMAADGSWGQYHGEYCGILTQVLQQFHDLPHVHLCCSGTFGIELALRASTVQSGDEVILSAYDYKANFANIVALQATPVLVDVAEASLSPSAEGFIDAITDRTKAIIVSHLHGWEAPVGAVKKIASERGIIVIEDACQNPGATVEGRTAGSVGDLGVLSFGGSKLLSAGRGGAVLTSDAQLAQRMKLLTQRGNDAYPLAEMQAAVLKPQLEQLPERNRIRAKNIQLLCGDWPDDCFVQPMLEAMFTKAAFYKLPFRLTDPSEDRADVIARLREKGVPISEAFPGLHRIHAARRFRIHGSLLNTDLLHENLMTLHHPILLQDEQVIQQLKECFG